MMLPSRLILTGSAYALDGGTTCLTATDEAGREHAIMLVQHSRPERSPSFAAVPGRLYYDGELVALRSAAEAGVLSLLRSAEVRYVAPRIDPREQIVLSPKACIFGNDIREVLTRGPEDNIRALTAQVVAFVESDDYLRFAERVEQAADETRYGVWVEWAAASFNRAVVAAKQVVGGTLREARAVVEQQRPVAIGLSAPAVVEMAARFRAAGLDVRVSPAFRWPLP